MTSAADIAAIAAKLEAAYGLPEGDEKEREIASLSIDYVLADIQAFAPTTTYALLDWGTEPGLQVVSLHLADGSPVPFPEVEAEAGGGGLHNLMASNIRSIEYVTPGTLVETVRGRGDGPYRLYIAARDA